MKIYTFGMRILLATVLLAGPAAQAEPLVAKQYSDFDRYVLALSWQSSFCQSLHDRNNQEPVECHLQNDKTDKARNLTVHGLWPGLPKSVAARGVDQRRWMRYGCATRPIPGMQYIHASKKCEADEIGMSLEMAAKLNDVMPGSGGKSCLERYEYAKHAVCFGFDPDAWSEALVRLNHEVKESPLGNFLVEHYGQQVNRQDFDAAVAKAWGQDAVKSINLRCNGNPVYLTEIWFTLKASTINYPLSRHSFLKQPHPGNCPQQFILDAAGY